MIWDIFPLKKEKNGKTNLGLWFIINRFSSDLLIGKIKIIRKYTLVDK